MIDTMKKIHPLIAVVGQNSVNQKRSLSSIKFSFISH